jgi:GrpB-like predicted nucleotidyltransferase (UPF0157 family)
MTASLGLPTGQLQLVARHSEWKACFLAEHARLRAALGESVVDIQHVGSTAVPGLLAKPILDLAIAVRGFEDAAGTLPVMESLGYESRGEAGIARRRYFVKGQPRTHHVHMLEQHSEAWRDHLLFRDTLISNPQERQAYAALKTELARPGADRSAYQLGKEPFITALLQRARAAAR